MKNNAWVESTLSNMSLEEKIGQLLLVGLWNLNEETAEEIAAKIISYKLGGIFHFSLPYQFIGDFAEKLQQKSDIPLFISCDYEAGTGTYVEGGFCFPRPMNRGWAGSEKEEYEIGKIIATQGRAIGVNFTFSPVVDVNTHYQCPDVNIRAYSDVPDRVTELARGYIRGLQENGMLATAKHFPGNGGTPMDQHISPAIIDYSPEVIENIYLKPYRELITQTEVAAIMVAHLEVPALVKELHPVSGRPVPASLSSEVITNLLKGKMSYRGMVMTDALNMGGVMNLYTREEATIKSLLAGNDLLLNFFAADFERDYESVYNAVQNGVIPIERIDDAVRTILLAKYKLKLDKEPGLPRPKEERDRAFLNSQYKEMAGGIAEKGITLLRNNLRILPLDDLSGKKVTVFNIFGPENRVLEGQGQFRMKEIISERLTERGALVTTYEVVSEWTISDLRERFNLAREAEVVFVNFFIVPNFAIGTLMPNINGVRLFFFGILTELRKVVITSFGDPWVMINFQPAPTYVCTFDEGLYSQEAAVKLWFGELNPTGKMPVSLKGVFKRGDGYNY